jgi:hypothetical protein
MINKIYKRLMEVTMRFMNYHLAGLDVKQHPDYNYFLMLLGMVQMLRLQGEQFPEVELCFQMAGITEEELEWMQRL